MKVCTKCGESKEATTEFFQQDKRISTGLTGKCRVCINDYYKAYNNRKKIGDNPDIRSYIAQSNIPIVPIPKINMLKGHCYSIQTPKRRKEEVGRVVSGKVIQETDKLIVMQTKNYIESFSRWELSQYKIMEV